MNTPFVHDLPAQSYVDGLLGLSNYRLEIIWVCPLVAEDV